MREILDPCDICPRRRRCCAEICEMSGDEYHKAVQEEADEKGDREYDAWVDEGKPKHRANGCYDYD